MEASRADDPLTDSNRTTPMDGTLARIYGRTPEDRLLLLFGEEDDAHIAVVDEVALRSSGHLLQR